MRQFTGPSRNRLSIQLDGSGWSLPNIRFLIGTRGHKLYVGTSIYDIRRGLKRVVVTQDTRDPANATVPGEIKLAKKRATILNKHKDFLDWLCGPDLENISRFAWHYKHEIARGPCDFTVVENLPVEEWKKLKTE